MGEWISPIVENLNASPPARRVRNRRARVRFPVFNGYEVRIILSRDVKSTCRRLQAAPDDSTIACFFPCPSGRGRGWLVLPLVPDEGTIAHEASHAIAELFRWAGARRDEETFAYHLDYLVGRVHKFLKRGAQCA